MTQSITLSSIERQEQLLRFVQLRQRVTVDEILQEFGVSAATARRDLDVLENQGSIQRFHGGAKSVQQAPPERPVLGRTSTQLEAKSRIALAASDLVNDGETIFLGSGTTVLEVARHLHGKQGLTVITNSLLVLNELSTDTAITVVGLGGMLRHSEMSMIGHITQQALEEIRVQKIMIGIRAIDVQHGLTNDYLPETLTDRAILDKSDQIIIVADHSKCGRVSTAFLAPVTAVQTLITDTLAPPHFVAALQAKGIDVLIAE